MTNREDSIVLSDLWFNVENPSAFTSVNNLWKAANNKGLKISKSKVKEWLHAQEVYTKYAPVYQKIRRGRILTWGPDYLYQADLADVSNISKWNSGIKWLLVVICTFSKMVWVRGMKQKSGSEVMIALKSIFETTGRRPLYFQTDLGTEFFNEKVWNYLKENGIHHYGARNNVKAAIAER
jgi:hypothetical protein